MGGNRPGDAGPVGDVGPANDGRAEAGGLDCPADAGAAVDMCDGSVCAPTPLFPNQPKPGAVGVDGSFVYWVVKSGTTYSLHRGPKRGGCPSLVAPNIASGIVRDLLVDDQAVYVGTTDLAHAVVRVDKATGAAVDIVNRNVCTTGSPGVLAQNTTHLFFACADAGGRIGRWDKTADAAAPALIHDPDEMLTFGGLAADSSTLYWTLEKGSIESVPAAGGTARTVSIADSFERIALIGPTVYAMSATQVLSIGTAGGGSNPVLSMLQDPVDLRADAQGIFVAMRGSGDGEGSVLGAFTNQLGFRTLASALGRPAGIATDLTYVYVTDEVAGTVLRLKK